MERIRFFVEGIGLKLVVVVGILFLMMLISSLISQAKVLDDEEKIIDDHLSRHAVKTVQSEDGDTIDCIDIYKQPAFGHPALRNHTIQMAPSEDPSVETTSTTESPKSSAPSGGQLWWRSGSCPRGTIPVRRNKRKDGAKTTSFRKKPPMSSPRHSTVPVDDDNKIPNLQQINHSMAILFTAGYNYNGAKGDIRVWNPYVEFDDEWSLSQIALQNGPYNDFESVESGWAVNPGLYGDRQTRFFVYWTIWSEFGLYETTTCFVQVDASKTTGCFDLTCPGFVQTNHEIALGAAIYPISTPDGLPYQITIYIFKVRNTEQMKSDLITSNLWVQYGDGINIGYWPAELFTTLTLTVETVQWGGEVYSSRVGVTPHTATQMGSGEFPDYVWDVSGWVKKMRIRDNSLILKVPEWAGTYTDEYRCYDVRYVTDYVEDPEFYYGGPGRGPLCP
ncbi:uncharacterized protein LOC116188672 [Punica granatum]|uniref:Uncharacterized protein LOC116188672 n=1 Tax=Punica granatum TaxID=22663 RepID=A0A6P8BUS2_PUNGR|nr:uncharacterized protein LOC116188672 [Punica granatum]